MHATITALKNALGYAKFSDDDVKEATLELVDQLGTDLDAAEQEYEPGSGVEMAQRELEEVLNRVDSATEDTEDAIKNARTTGVDDDEDDSDNVDRSLS